MQLESGMSSDIIFDVEDSASNIVGDADGLDEARDITVYDTVNGYVSNASMSDAETIEGIDNSGSTTYNILDTAQNLYDLEITPEQVQDYMDAAPGVGESVTYAQLVQYVGLVPNGDSTNAATNANYTDGEIAAYKSAIPAGSSFENVETYVANEPAATLTEYTVTSDANATGLSLTGVTPVSISGNGSGNWTVLVNVGDTIAAESVTQTLPEGTEATSEISISAGTVYDNSAAIAVYQSNASFITGQTWDAEAIYQLVPAIAARHQDFGGTETNETIVPYLSALPGAISSYTGDFAALGDYLSATPDVVDADQYFDRANGVINGFISNVEASDDATVDIGERLASYSTPVVFDIADDISNVIGSVLQTTNNFADVRDIVINDIANISEGNSVGRSF